jgi:predicted phage terminase large subunit-like protein
MLAPNDYRFLLRNDLMSFIEKGFYELNPQTRFSSSPHIEVLASRLEECRRGKIKRLVVNLPPRSLKSLAVSVAFPGWVLGHDPAAQIICASYGQDLADKHARDCRTLMLSSSYRSLFPRTRLSPYKQSTNEFTTTMQGFRMSTSVGGVLTGRGADFIILDDPLKPDEAMSETRRKAVNNWYDNSLLSRLNNKQTGCIILVMQRLHQDDLVGHVLEQEQWDVVSFPAIAGEDENFVIESPWGRSWFRRKQGDVLQPDRESKVTLMNIRRTLGEYHFESQYQQNPMPVGGAIVKADWVRYYEPGDLPQRFSYIVQSWDTANKSGQLNDYSVCTTWGWRPKAYYLLSVFRKRLNYPDLRMAVKEQAARHGPAHIVIEDRASGTQLLQDLRADGVLGLKPYEPATNGDKVMRLYAQTAEFEGGFVRLPKSASWLDDFLRELLTFPGSKYDDQVDSTTQALEFFKTKRSLMTWANL